MRPNFALSLSFSGIQLLQRQDTGWGRVGDVDIGSGDLAGDLRALHAKASTLGSGPVETKLIIPDDQIKYLTVDASGLDKAELQTAVLNALDGATPYPVEELEFDFANEAGRVHIAAVAKETLQEAEAFANEHGFEPLGFVAAPAADKFPKEPSFGPSALAVSKGLTTFETDAAPAIATGEAITISPKAAPVPTPTPEPEVAPETKPDVLPEAAPDVFVEPAQAVGFSSRRASVDPMPASAEAVEPELDLQPKVEPIVQPVVPAPTIPKSSAPDLAPRLDGAKRTMDQTLSPPVSAPSIAQTPQPPVVNAPEITGLSEAALNEEDVAAQVQALRPNAASDPDGIVDDIPPMPVGASVSLPKRKTFSATGPSSVEETHAPQFENSEDTKNRAGAKAAAIATSAGAAALSGLRGLMARRKAASDAKAASKAEKASATSDTLVEPEDEKQRMTIFGARKPAKKKEAIAIGGKPRFLGLILTAILLLFLVSVAAWASVFLDEGLARFFGNEERNRAITELPVQAAEPSEEELIELASLESGEDDIVISDLLLGQDGLAQLEPVPPPISPEEAAAKYAATGIWLATPVQPMSPVKISLEDVYAASIDKRIIGQDAFALEPLAQPRDTLPKGFLAPAPAGVEFAFDENGFVVASPDGALTPEGALVFLGRPAVIPPAIPERLRTAALTPEEIIVDPEAIELPELSSLRPKLRPKTLIEDTERTQLGGNSRAELAKLRPKMRPQLAKAIEETETAAAPATRLAIASSRKPSQRPRNMARIVAKAQKQQQQSETQATQVAAVAPRSVTPRIPSSASVAKSATVRNAINLSRVNLIGVYGKPSSRRALVRLASGRYKKVKVGDRVDGGRVAAIGEGQLVYTRSGRNVTLRMPKD